LNGENEERRNKNKITGGRGKEVRKIGIGGGQGKNYDGGTRKMTRLEKKR
jgi:hypothetical protein